MGHEPQIALNSMDAVLQAPEASLGELMEAWRMRARSQQVIDQGVYEALCTRILELGQPLLAFDIASKGLSSLPDNLHLKRCLALSLARTGASKRANLALRRLIREKPSDSETLGLLARTYKDLWSADNRKHWKDIYLNQSIKYYRRAYDQFDSTWSGINAATLLAIKGDQQAAATLAHEVGRKCSEALTRSTKTHTENYWFLATLAESSAIQEQWSEAEAYYRQVSNLVTHDYGNLTTTRRQALLLVDHLNGPREQISACFKTPTIIPFVGHMIDRPDRLKSRFPLPAEHEVRSQLKKYLEAIKPLFGISSAACGSDILFLEMVLELGGEIQIVLPYPVDEFLRESVDLVPGTDWSQRFHRLVAHAEKRSQLVIVSPHKLTRDDITYEYSNRVMFGLAMLRADQLLATVNPLAVWNGQLSDDRGGTGATIHMMRQQGFSFKYLDLSKVACRDAQDSTPMREVGPIKNFAERKDPLAESLEHEEEVLTKAMLFADVKGYSKLKDTQISSFVANYLGKIAELLNEVDQAPAFKNTWGDALYCVFDSVQSAGVFALRLRDRLQKTDWIAFGLPTNLAIRIALHAGPVMRCVDPVTGQSTYSGSHTSRAARIEPITPPNHVYASEAFAALARLEGIAEFACDYVGETPTAKGYGLLPMYHVHW